LCGTMKLLGGASQALAGDGRARYAPPSSRPFSPFTHHGSLSMTTRRSGVNRRDFLGTAAAAAVPLIVSRTALGDDQKWAASDRLGLGFIGMGTMARGHLGFFLNQKEVQVIAVCDVDITRRDAAKNTVETKYAEQMKSGQYKGCAAYNDFRDLLARKDIDA